MLLGAFPQFASAIVPFNFRPLFNFFPLRTGIQTFLYAARTVSQTMFLIDPVGERKRKKQQAQEQNNDNGRQDQTSQQQRRVENAWQGAAPKVAAGGSCVWALRH